MKGIGASPGIAVGKVFVRAGALEVSKNCIDNREQELNRLNEAVENVKHQLQSLIHKTKKEIGEEEAEIFEAHRLMLMDPDFLQIIIDGINVGRKNAEWAVESAVEEYKRLFDGIEDSYIKERILDLKDVATHLLKNLQGKASLSISNLTEPVIIAAHELAPSDTASLPRGKVLGIVTETGGATSHTAILSRVMGIPAIVGTNAFVDKLVDGDILAMDGDSGEFDIRPEPELLKVYLTRQQEQRQEKEALRAYIGKKIRARDGRFIEVHCNIGSPGDIEAVLENDGEAIGLFRSEFLYMDRNSFPSEEEQFEAYRAVASVMGERGVIIRTLDIGGDKELPYLKLPKEDNPFLGLRAIRYCLQEKGVFKSQLRAILRASAFGRVKIMLPMISGIGELREGKALICEAMEELRCEGYCFDPQIKVGIMVETPGAAVIADILAKESDFFSIGTNDLTQYTLAADRMNQNVSKLYTPFHPAVLRLVKTIIDSGHKAGIPVGMCGEAAENQRMIPVLAAMGLDEFSVSPSMVLKVRKTLCSINKTLRADLVEELLLQPDPEAVEHFIESKIK